MYILDQPFFYTIFFLHFRLKCGILISIKHKVGSFPEKGQDDEGYIQKFNDALRFL